MNDEPRTSRGLVWGEYISRPALYLDGKLYASISPMGVAGKPGGWLVFIHAAGAREVTSEYVALTEDDGRHLAEKRARRLLDSRSRSWDFSFSDVGCIAIIAAIFVIVYGAVAHWGALIQGALR